MQSDITLKGYYVLIIYVFYSILDLNSYHFKNIINLVLNITPFYFLIVLNILFFIYIIFKIRIRVNFNISFN